MENRGSIEPAASGAPGEVRRPAPDEGWWRRLIGRLHLERERLAARRHSVLDPSGPVDDPSDNGRPTWDGERDMTWVSSAMIAIGSATLALGSLWAWQSWQGRSAEPIDELLPVLVSTAAEVGAPTAVPSVTPAGAEPTSATATAVPDPLPTSVPEIVVHVSGAVRSPGVVRLDPGARVFEAVEAAGGAAAAADLDRVNLAAPVVDGERVHVPVVGQDTIPDVVPSHRPPVAAASGDDPAPSVAPTPQIVDLNRASSVELQMLPGVGPATADAIVRTRDERGPFRAVDELLEVPGIGDTKLALLQPHVMVGG